jgi:hypothetical protein
VAREAVDAAAIVGAVRRVHRGETDAVVARVDELLEPRGGLARMAGAATAARVVRVDLQFHRVDRDQADALRALRAVAVDVHIERVAVGHERGLAGPDEAGGAGFAGETGATARSFGCGRGRQEEQGEVEVEAQGHPAGEASFPF